MEKKKKKNVVKKKKIKKGFTLIELLAVIIILGVIMLIAVPSVTKYINDSRKDTYIDTAKQVVKGAIPLVNSGELDVYDTNTTYYIPAKCISTENSMSSPFGEFVNAYVIVGYSGEGYEYYWTSVDESHQGIEMKEYNKLSRNDVKPNVEKVEPNIGIGDRENIRILDEESCQGFSNPTVAGKTIDENGEITEILPCNNFGGDTWDTIIRSVKSSETNCYSLGDTKTINLGTYGVHTVRIANMSTPSECNQENFSQSACGIVIEFTDLVTTGKMNAVNNLPVNDSNVGGWATSNMRDFVNNEIYNSLPSNLKSHVIDTYTVSGLSGRTTQTVVTSTDKLYLLALKEVGITSNNDQGGAYTRILDYYNAHNTGQARYKTRNVDDWWLRTVFKNSSRNEFYILYSGYDVYREPTYTYGISPAFRIG